jgi:hypothetical protein
MKSIFAVLLMAAMASVAPQAAHAQAKVKVMLVGSSGIWQAMAVGAYKGGACPTGSSTGCAHYTNKSFNLNDTRPTLHSLGGTTATDVANIWIVWDNTSADPTCATACNVWAYLKVDNTVGARCYFAVPRCNINVTAFPAAQQVIGTNIWGADTLPPTPVQNIFTSPSGVLATAQAADIRPEDSLYAQCRVNSAAGGGSDGLDGLGLGVNASGVCPAFGANLAHLEGTDLTSSYPSSTSTAHNLAFNISGTDPFTGSKIPVATVVPVGAIPIVFITQRTGALANVTNATMSQLQDAFSGVNCKGNNFAGGTAGNIGVYLREALSGTMNTTEYTTFRLPRDSSGNFAGESQETGLTGLATVNNVACTAGGARWSVIGTGEEVNFVKNSNADNGFDGIGYTFMSYGNVSGIASSANYGYLTVDGADPIWQVYGSTYDPGQSAIAGALPGTGDLPASCAGAFPCSETVIWKGKLSYPNVRSGAYRQWSGSSG